MGKTTARANLARNLSQLMDAPGCLYGSAPALEKATVTKGGLKVGRSTIQRMRNAETPVNLGG